MDRHKLLITSVSRKVPLVKAAQAAVAKAGGGTVVGVDMDPNCLARYFVDEFIPCASLDVEEIVAMGVTAILPTRDGELPFFAEHKNAFESHGISVMISPLHAVMLSLDKFHFSKKLHELGYPTPRTTLSINDLDVEEFVVKERYGAGARAVGLRLRREEAKEFAASLSQPIFQPYIEGSETSVDLFLSRHGKAKGAVCRTRDLVVGGESQISMTYQNADLESSLSTLSEKIGLTGHVLFQVINGQIIECNPRVGGASTLSFAAGLESLYWFLLEDEELPPFVLRDKVLRLIRYPEDWIL